MHNENRPSHHSDLANAQSMMLRTFFVDIVLYALGMLLLAMATYLASDTTLMIACVMVTLAAIHGAWTWCKDSDDQIKR